MLTGFSNGDSGVVSKTGGGPEKETDTAYSKKGTQQRGQTLKKNSVPRKGERSEKGLQYNFS